MQSWRIGEDGDKSVLKINRPLRRLHERHFDLDIRDDWQLGELDLVDKHPRYPNRPR